MISPVIVDMRHGLTTCMGCGKPHTLYTGSDVREAEQAADAHLKAIRALEVPDVLG